MQDLRARVSRLRHGLLQHRPQRRVSCTSHKGLRRRSLRRPPRPPLRGGFGRGRVDEESMVAEGNSDSLRAEWAKSLARAERWEEEVVLIPIEMRRVIRGLSWKARDWRQRVVSPTSASLRVHAGYTSYAEKQAWQLEALARAWRRQTTVNNHPGRRGSLWPDA